MPTVETSRTYCRVCTCQCGLTVEATDGHVIRVRGDKAHPVSKGYTCPKGRALGQLHDHPDAIDRPYLRRDGVAETATWDECLDDLATCLRGIIDAHGPASVGVFFGSGLGMDAAGFRMAEAFFAQLGSPAKFSPMTIDGTAKVLVASLVGGFPGLSPRPDYARAGMVIFVGVNPLVSHGHNIAMVNPALILKDVAARGQAWMIDPRENDSTPFVTRHLAPRPGTDHAVLGFLVRALLEAGEDRPAQPVTGREALRAAVAPFTRAAAAGIVGVAEDALDDLLAAVRAAGPVVVETGTGVTMAGSANVTQWLAWALMILTGATNRPGGVWFHPGFVTPLDMAELPVFDQPWTPGPPSRPELTGLIGDWPCAALADEIEAGNIRAVVNFGGSLLRSFPDANRLAPALAKLDVLASFEIVENETTALSTHVLPTRGQLERADVTLWDFLNAQVSLQYSPAVLPARGERRAAWWIIAALMRRMGMETPDTPDDGAAGADDAMLERLMPYARRGFAELREARYVETPLELPARWVDAHVERIGGWRLAPPSLVEQLATLVEAAPTADAPLLLIPRRQRRHLNAAFLFLGDAPEVLVNPADAVAAGLADGAPVMVRNAAGDITGVTRFDPGMRAGVISVPHGHAGANVNRLTSQDAVDRLTGMVLYSGIPVRIEPVAA